MVILFLGGWLYLEYLNNPYLQVYVQNVLRVYGVWIGVILGLALTGLALGVVFYVKAAGKMLQISAVAQVAGIGFQSAWLWMEYANDPLMQQYVAGVLRTHGLTIGLGLGSAVAASLYLTVPGILRRLVAWKWTIPTLEGLLIGMLSAMLYLEDLGNLSMGIYVLRHRLLFLAGIGAATSLTIASVWLTKIGLTQRVGRRVARAAYRIRHDILAFFAYAIMTLVLTFPVILHVRQYVPWTSLDVWHSFWNLWWIKASVGSFQNPYYTYVMLYPSGTSVLFQGFTFVNSLPGIFLQGPLGLVLTYNLFFFTSYILSGFNAYLLAKSVTREKVGSFIAGVVYAFAPIHVAQSMAHLNIMTQQWLPLYLLFLFRLRDQTELRNVVYASIALLLVALSDLHFLIMALLLTALFTVYLLWKERSPILSSAFIPRLVLTLVSTVVLMLPFMFPIISGVLLGTAGYSAEPLSADVRNSADLAAFFIPGPTNPIFRNLVRNIYLPISPFTYTSQYVYAGYTTIALALIGFALAWKRQNGLRVRFWLLSLLTFGILSLGPYVTLLGNMTQLPLPYLYLYYLIRVFQSIRTPYRLDIVVMLTLAVLAAIALSRMFERYGTRKILKAIAYKKFVAVLVSVLILVEFFAAPMPVVPAQIPSYYNIIRNDPGQFAVMEVPIDLTLDVYLLYQTFHGKFLVNGHAARTPDYALVFQQSTPFIRLLRNDTSVLASPPKDILVQDINETKIVPYILGQFNIRYVILHRHILTKAGLAAVVTFDAIHSLLQQTIGNPIYEDSEAALFRYDNQGPLNLSTYVTTASSNGSLMILQGNWAPLVHNRRWISTNAQIEVFSGQPSRYQLNFTATGISGNRTLEVYFNKQLISRFLVSPGFAKYSTAPFQAASPVGTISFVSPEGCIALSLQNPRCVSVEFRTINLIPTPG